MMLQLRNELFFFSGFHHVLIVSYHHFIEGQIDKAIETINSLISEYLKQYDNRYQGRVSKGACYGIITEQQVLRDKWHGLMTRDETLGLFEIFREKVLDNSAIEIISQELKPSHGSSYRLYVVKLHDFKNRKT